MFNFKEYLMFDKLLTTWIVRVVYWIGQVAIVRISIQTMFFDSEFNLLITGDDDPIFILGLLILIFGSLILRLVTESIIVLFKIYENTEKIKD